MNRRTWIGAAGAAIASAVLRAQARRFRISLAQWSLHKAIQGRWMSNLDFPRVAREQFGIEGLEFVNQLWEAPTQDYVARLKANMKKFGVQGVLIMCDGEGPMGHSGKQERMKAATNHFKWADIAAELGCHAIRCNAYPDKQPATPAEIDAYIGYCAESFAKLSEYAKGRNINVIIENHGGVSSNPDVLARLVKQVNLSNFGLLPDFGNFYSGTDHYDAVSKMMPHAKGVSFKCYDFGPDGKETKLDMDRLMKIVAGAGYKGWVGIEYEGSRMSEFEGIQAAKRWLDGWIAANI